MVQPRTNQSFCRAIFLVLIMLVLSSCGGGGGGTIAPITTPAPTGDSDSQGGDASGGGDDSDSDGNETGDDSGSDGSAGDNGEPVNPPDTLGIQAPLSTNVGHPSLLSPHANPIVLNGHFVYAANTAADTVDVIDTQTHGVVRRISVGVDPVGLAVRPDGKEVWVANHVSDSVSVIDTDPDSPFLHNVKATVQAVEPDSLATRFDEPVGIAFTADGQKAYVTLGPDNEVAVVDVTSYTVTRRLAIRAQDPRALAVSGDRLYVTAFESNNRTQLSGCRPERVDGDTCTFDAVEHVFTNNNVLSLDYDADIVRNPALPDRDLFIFDTATDQLVRTVEGVGTLLYGVVVDSHQRVFVTQTDARNDANGRAGTLKHGLSEMENRAFLNQITRVDCSAGGSCELKFFDLEPVPPDHPGPGMALATPFSIQISDDDSTLVATAASSNKLITLNPDTGEVLGRVDVGAVPRGIAVRSDDLGAPQTAWVLSVVDNSVAVVDLSSPTSPGVVTTIALDDPTHPDVKAGRRVFNDASASSTGTFSCESCHPDGHTDQLIWVLDTPVCDIDGCTQIPPRLTMPVRGLRDTAPYHWDGIPGDPFGGTNTASINDAVTPNCDDSNPESCTRVLVDGSLATTMCLQGDCSINDEGKQGLVDAAGRDALARFLLSVPYPPAPHRSLDNTLDASAREGFFEFSFTNDAADRATGAQTCGDCHKMPFLVSTNTPGTGMDAPTWRGAYDRWMILPQGRLNIIDLMDIVNMDDSFPERDVWILAGASPDIWEMVLQGSTGFPGSFARQLTLNHLSAGQDLTNVMLDKLELAATEGAVVLQGEGVQISEEEAAGLAVEYRDGHYYLWDDTASFTRAALIDAAVAGKLVLTLTARAGANVDLDHPQPALWPVAPIEAQTRNVDLAFLSGAATLTVNGRHIREGASLFLNGRKVDGTVRCESGALPNCDDEVIVIAFDTGPSEGGLHFLQVQNPQGLFSNDMMFFSEQAPVPARPGNLITSGGAFTPGQRQFDNNWNTVEIATNSIVESGGEVRVDVRAASNDPWHAQISHAVLVVAGQQYTLCYDARAEGTRVMTAYLDTNMDTWRNLSGGQFRDDLTTGYQTFRHTFFAAETDLRARVAFDLAQSNFDVQLDNIGLYEGASCGTP